MISICLPTYNRVDLLPDVIESVIDQTHKDWELIICDDGSTDSSSQILNFYAQNKNIKVIYTPHKGISHARKTAYNASSGDFIAVVDSDTPMHPNKLKESLAYLKKTKSDIVYTGAMAVFDREVVGEFYPEDINEVIKDPKDILKPNQVVPNYTILAKRECFEGAYRDEFTVNDDLWTIYYWVKKGYKFAYLKKLLMYHISDQKNVSLTHDKLVKKFTKQLQQEEK